MAWRWQQLLAARGRRTSALPWLTRAYFVSYAVGQVLPTSVGGDASRIYETSAAPSGADGSPITGSVLLERALGGAVTLVLAGDRLAARDRPLPDRRRTSGSRLLFVVATIVAGIVVLLARACGARCGFAVPLVRRAADRAAARAVYEGIHGYRDHPGTLLVGRAA